MNPTNPHPMAISADWQVARHYLYERKLLYRYLSDSTFPGPYQPPATYTDCSRGVTGQEDRGPQTVEQMLTDGYFAVPSGDPETALITDKRASAQLGLDDVIQQIQARVAIYEQNILEIEQAKCYAVSDLYGWESRNGWPASTEQYYILGKRLQELYADQRSERVTLWKDISRLRQALPEHVQGYLSAFRKLQVLAEPPGDAA